MHRIIVYKKAILDVSEFHEDVIEEIKKAFQKANPKYYANKNMKYSNWKVPEVIRTWELKRDQLSISRSGISKLCRILKRHNIEYKIIDNALVNKQKFLLKNLILRDYQQEAIDHVVQDYNSPNTFGSILRGPPGCGKTITCLGLMHALQQRTIIIVHDKDLLAQWASVLSKHTDLKVGLLGNGKDTKGDVIVAMEQTLLRRFEKKRFKNADQFGLMIADELHHWAAKTFNYVAQQFPCQYRFGVSADHRRKDGLEWVIEEVFGPLIHEIDRETLESTGSLVPIKSFIIPTNYRDEIFIENMNRPIEERTRLNWNSVVNGLLFDDDRNKFIFDFLKRRLENQPNMSLLILTLRRQSAFDWADRLNKFKTGLLLGGESSKESKITIAGLKSGEIRVGVGTTQKASEFLDIPRLTHVAVICPIKGPKAFEQIAGRSARAYPGKKHGTLYYFWDREMFTNPKRSLKKIGSVRVVVE